MEFSSCRCNARAGQQRQRRLWADRWHSEKILQKHIRPPKAIVPSTTYLPESSVLHQGNLVGPFMEFVDAVHRAETPSVDQQVVLLVCFSHLNIHSTCRVISRVEELTGGPCFMRRWKAWGGWKSRRSKGTHPRSELLKSILRKSAKTVRIIRAAPGWLCRWRFITCYWTLVDTLE